MKFKQLMQAVQEQPLFETGHLLAGDVNPADVRRQLSRWVSLGKVLQLRRGLYALAPPYQKTQPHPFVVANALATGSYVSGQSALAFYGLIPEYVPSVTSIASRRPAEWHNPLGDFTFRYIAPHLFFGYQKTELPLGQQAFIAEPEKALLDLIHLTPGGDSDAYLRELRLQNLERLDTTRLRKFVARGKKPKWERAALQIIRLIEDEGTGYQPLDD